MLNEKFLKFLAWFGILILVIAGSLLANFKQAKADEIAVPQVQFGQAFDRGSADISKIKIPVALSIMSSEDASVEYAVIDNGTTAVSGTDYVLPAGILIIPAGDISFDIVLTIIDTHLCQSDKMIKIGLFNPVNATLGSQNDFTYKILQSNCELRTSLLTDPPTADGQDGWFVTEPIITLTVNKRTKTFYQWDATNCGEWQLYTGPFLGVEGDHVLYFYSVQHHRKEPVQSREIKVDLTPPSTPTVSISVDDNGLVHLSWEAVNGALSYQVWRTDTSQMISVDQLTFIDSTVLRGQTYQYNVLAIDSAGNKSPLAHISVLVPELSVIEPISVISTPVVMESAKPKSISDGVKTSTFEEARPEIAGTTDNNTLTASSEETATHRNWNQLLLAISILIIAIGAAIGGYYGYEWFMAHREEPPKDGRPKSKSRW